MTVSTHKDNDKWVESEEECSICLEPLNLSSDVKKWPTDKSLVSVLKPCLHVYHDSCIKFWAKSSNSCPLCKNNFQKEDIFQLNGIRRMRHFRINMKASLTKMARKVHLRVRRN